jgi:hypothetical protein
VLAPLEQAHQPDAPARSIMLDPLGAQVMRNTLARYLNEME